MVKKVRLGLYPLLLSVVVACSDASETTTPEQDPPKTWTIGESLDVETFLDCIEEKGVAVVSAHRGGPARFAPENSIKAFKRTLEAAPALIEFDVATSADGVLYLMHDDTLDRTTTGSGAVTKNPWDMVRKYRLIDFNGRIINNPPPTLEEALAYLKDKTIAQIDFKRTTKYEDVIDLVRRMDASHRVILIAYTTAQAQKLYRLAPEMKISASMELQSRLDEMIDVGIPPENLVAFTGTRNVQPDMNDVFDRADVEVIFGTLGGDRAIDKDIAANGNEERYASIAAAGVDIIATDRPLAAYSALKSAGRAPGDGVCGISGPKQ
ncbi:MAG: glycerophosphodiester phosphodiesterase family protein [Pseudomonadota bacterium]